LAKKKSKNFARNQFSMPMTFKLFGRVFGDLVTVCGSSWPMTYGWN
jgi:hypothetical protein